MCSVDGRGNVTKCHIKVADECGCACSLEYEDVVCDGLYDPWGDFPELQPNECSRVFPSLADLRAVQSRENDTREVPVQPTCSDLTWLGTCHCSFWDMLIIYMLLGCMQMPYVRGVTRA